MEKVFLMLQGPQSAFFKALGFALKEAGCGVIKVNFCGGDVFHWASPDTVNYRGRREAWPACVTELMEREHVTDLMLFGDWRPMHREAVALAKMRGIHVWVLEEGYYRKGYITLEAGGVNGRSPLPREADDVMHQAKALAEKGLPENRDEAGEAVANPLSKRVWDAVGHHTGNAILWPFFWRYKTHRPYSIAWELTGWAPRYVIRKKRRGQAAELLKSFYADPRPFFFFPLQLDSDAQVKLYSPFQGMEDAIRSILQSFAEHAPKECRLLIKNHPLDNGLINYTLLVQSLTKALGLHNRVCFVEEGHTGRMIKKSQGVVLLNSTVGMDGLAQGKPVYTLGQAIYALTAGREGQILACHGGVLQLADYWQKPQIPDAKLFNDYLLVLTHKALVRGNFYTQAGIAQAVQGCLKRLGVLNE